MVKTLVGTLDPDEPINSQCEACVDDPAEKFFPIEFCKKCNIHLCRKHYNRHMIYGHRLPDPHKEKWIRSTTTDTSLLGPPK